MGRDLKGHGCPKIIEGSATLPALEVAVAILVAQANTIGELIMEERCPPPRAFETFPKKSVIGWLNNGDYIMR